MTTKYENVFSSELLSLMLYYNNKIPQDAPLEEVYEVFDSWLARNKDWRDDISKLNEQQIKEYTSLIQQEIDLVKNKKDVFFPFDIVKLYLKRYLKSLEPKKPSKIDELKQQMRSPQLTPLSFNDFMLKEDKKEYYVKQMFAKGTINMIFSPPKQMKSFVSYYLALCLASGEPFLNQKTKKVGVGYFDWENPLSDIQNRVQGICNGMNFDCTSMNNFYFFNKQPTLLRVNNYDSFVIDELRDELLEFVKENDIKVLFFDTLRRLGNFDENDSGAINTIKSELFDPLIRECNICIIFLHHTSKEGKNYRGSVDIEGILDTSFKINKKDKDGEIKLNISCDARRNNEIDNLSALVEIDNNSFQDTDGEMFELIESVKFMRLAEEVEETNVVDYSQYRTYFIENLQIGRRYKNKDLIEIIDYNFGVKKVTANKIIKWLVKINVLKEFGENKNKYYILNPVHSDLEDQKQLKELDTHFKEMFKINDAVDIETLRAKFDEKFYSMIVDDWNKKGWINTAKAGYLIVTDLFKSENLQRVNVEEVDLNE